MLTIRITPVDGESYQVKTSLFTIIAWERRFKRPASDFGSQMAIEWLAFLGWEAAKERGLAVPESFDEFCKRLAKVDVIDEDDDENPTDPAL